VKVFFIEAMVVAGTILILLAFLPLFLVIGFFSGLIFE
jgi:hypothetical protein